LRGLNGKTLGPTLSNGLETGCGARTGEVIDDPIPSHPIVPISRLVICTEYSPNRHRLWIWSHQYIHLTRWLFNGGAS